MTTILVVDDNPMNIDLLLQFFEMKGYTTRTATNGEEALESVAAERPDLIIMDMSMPIMSGWETTKQLKADPATSAIPVLALTAHAMKADQQRAMDVGCDGYMVKPMDLIELDATLTALLNRR